MQSAKGISQRLPGSAWVAQMARELAKHQEANAEGFKLMHSLREALERFLLSRLVKYMLPRSVITARLIFCRVSQFGTELYSRKST